MNYYVKINLLRVGGILGVPNGQKRTRDDGAVEAEFLVITPGCHQAKVWATREDLFTNET